MKLPKAPRVAVVGATGAVGRVMLDVLHQRDFPASDVVAVASARSAGRIIPFGDEELSVKALSKEVFEGIDLVLLDTPDEVAAEWAPVAVSAGAVVVDNSAAWRADAEVPLVIPEANPDAVESHKGIIASPNCATIGVVVPLAPLHRRFHLERLIVSTYQATSGAGRGGVEELDEQSRKMVGEIEALGTKEAMAHAPDPQVFAAPIAYNVVPLVGRVRAGGATGEELKMQTETQKILDLPDLKVFATCVRVPTVVGHGASVHARFKNPIDAGEAQEMLSGASGVELSDVPNPLATAGTDACFVGRIKADPFDDKSLGFFTVSDNLRKGAALNSVQIAELLLP
jgi:aspartate-semialdehyde dehydrogenase